jgi:hypothetical protein
MARTVWLASYPKSGNTWLRAVHEALVTGAEPDINNLGHDYPAAARWAFDVNLGLRSSDMTGEELALLRPHADEALAAGAGTDVWRKAHDALIPGPAGEPVVGVAGACSAIYVVRDPRDVAVSLAHHAGRSAAWAVEAMCDPAWTMSVSSGSLGSQLPQRLGTWSEHVLSWTRQQRVPVHVLRFEDCVSHPVESFHGAFTAVGLEVSEGEVALAVERGSWQRLRRQEEESGFRERLAEGSYFFRRGEVGAWKEELPAPLAGRVVEHHGRVMVELGYL